MKSPLASGDWLEFSSVESTQAVAAQKLKADEPVGVILAYDQTSGRGRFGREWLSRKDESLTASLVFGAYADHPKPWLIGMAVAVAAAGAIKSQIQWPNDLTIRLKKVGGILTELLTDANGRKVPVVGIGLNLGQKSFPDDLAKRATSILIERGELLNPQTVLHSILYRLEQLPEPTCWRALQSAWELFDDTPGKLYRMPDGTKANALGIGPEGELLASIDGETVTVMAAEAFFGE